MIGISDMKGYRYMRLPLQLLCHITLWTNQYHLTSIIYAGTAQCVRHSFLSIKQMTDSIYLVLGEEELIAVCI